MLEDWKQVRHCDDMKKFLIKGPETQKEFEIEDDEMIQWEVIKIKDYERIQRPTPQS